LDVVSTGRSSSTVSIVHSSMTSQTSLLMEKLFSLLKPSTISEQPLQQQQPDPIYASQQFLAAVIIIFGGNNSNNSNNCYQETAMITEKHWQTIILSLPRAIQFLLPLVQKTIAMSLEEPSLASMFLTLGPDLISSEFEHNWTPIILKWLHRNDLYGKETIYYYYYLFLFYVIKIDLI
jgi:hypothetical protein